MIISKNKIIQCLNNAEPRNLQSMPWSNILETILTREITIEYLKDENADKEKFRYINFREAEPDLLQNPLKLATDELVEYSPITSGPTITYFGSKIIYDVEKIITTADQILLKISDNLEISPPPAELVKLFRWVFSHAIRRHALFHYLVERGCRLLPENRYEEYRVKIYGRRKEAGEGNLEEALAEAYAITYLRKDLNKLPDSKLFEREELVTGLYRMTRYALINDRRPPGYKEARRFINEFETLLELEGNPEKVKELLTYSVLMKGGRALEGVFRGLSWLFYELTSLEAVNFTEKSRPPAHPYPVKDFLIFLENFRRDDSLVLLLLLPPDESTKTPD